MAEIHILFFTSRTPAQQARMEWVLTKVFEDGVDLGSRVRHIQAARANLEHMVDGLQRAIDRLQHWLGEHGLHDEEIDRALNQLVRQTSRAGCRL